MFLTVESKMDSAICANLTPRRREEFGPGRELAGNSRAPGAPPKSPAARASLGETNWYIEAGTSKYPVSSEGGSAPGRCGTKKRCDTLSLIGGSKPASL